MEKTFPNERECKHGSLRRKCHVCELEVELAEAIGREEALESELMRLTVSGEQSRAGSFTEACLNTATGWVVAYCVWDFIAAPMVGVESSAGQSAAVTTIFSVVSVIRSYLWRRAFVWWQRRKGN